MGRIKAIAFDKTRTLTQGYQKYRILLHLMVLEKKMYLLVPPGLKSFPSILSLEVS